MLHQSIAKAACHDSGAILKPQISRLFRAAGWLLLAAIIVLTVVPPQHRPETGAPSELEHLGIFLLTGLAFGLGYGQRHLIQVCSLVAFAGAIELVQVLVPGRHSRLSDFVVDALSASVGVGLAVVVLIRIASHRQSRPSART